MSVLSRALGGTATHTKLTENDVLAVASYLRGGRDAGVALPIVSGLNALKNPSVFSAVDITSEAMSAMPAHAMVRLSDGTVQPLDQQPAILEEPSADIEWGDWVYAMMVSLQTSGNGVNEIVARDDANRPRLLESINPARLTVREKFIDPDRRDKRRTLIGWWVEGSRLPLDDVAHIRAYTAPGSRVGMSPVEHARVQVILGIMAERFGLDVYRRDGRLTGVLTSDQVLDPVESDQISQEWESAMRRGRTPVLGKNAKFDRVSLSLEEAQALDVQRWSAEQVARVFRVPLDILQLATSGSAVTYANRTQSMTSWHQLSLAGWQRRLEKRLTKLLYPDEPNVFVKLNPAGLLRADTKTRYETYGIGLSNNFLDISEVREWEDLPPRDDLEQAPPEGAVDLDYDDDGNVVGWTPRRSAPTTPAGGN